MLYVPVSLLSGRARNSADLLVSCAIFRSGTHFTVLFVRLVPFLAEKSHLILKHKSLDSRNRGVIAMILVQAS